MMMCIAMAMARSHLGVFAGTKKGDEDIHVKS